MAEPFAYPRSQEFPELSPKIAFHDLGTLLTMSQSSSLRKGLLFMSTPLYLATSGDRAFLRERLKTRTIISTLHPKEPRYTRGQTPGSYITEQYVVEDFLGLRAFHIHLRHGDEFIRNAINELPLQSQMKFQYDAAIAKDLQNPDLVQMAQDLVWNRDSIDDSFAILTTSAPLIGRLFNDVLCDAKSYPLIMSGDFMLHDNGLLMFLLFLLLDIPIFAAENAYMRIAEESFSKGKEAGVKETPVTQAWAANRERWVKELLRRLEGRYGSASAYFASAGISKATRAKIKDVLLVSEEKILVDIS